MNNETWAWLEGGLDEHKHFREGVRRSGCPTSQALQPIYVFNTNTIVKCFSSKQSFNGVMSENSTTRKRILRDDGFIHGCWIFSYLWTLAFDPQQMLTLHWTVQSGTMGSHHPLGDTVTVLALDKRCLPHFVLKKNSRVKNQNNSFSSGTSTAT